MNKIESFKNIVDQMQESIEKTKQLPQTKKRLAYISELESRIAYREDRILEMEIEKQIKEAQNK